MNKKIANTVTNPHNNFSERIKTLLFDNKVMIVFAFLCFGAFMVSGMQLEAVVGEVFTRIARNGFTVLSLLIRSLPVWDLTSVLSLALLQHRLRYLL